MLHEAADGPQGCWAADGPQGCGVANGPQGCRAANGPQGCRAVNGPRGCRAVNGPQGCRVANGPRGCRVANGPQGCGVANGLQGYGAADGPQGCGAANGPCGCRVTTLERCSGTVPSSRPASHPSAPCPHPWHILGGFRHAVPSRKSLTEALPATSPSPAPSQAAIRQAPPKKPSAERHCCPHTEAFLYKEDPRHARTQISPSSPRSPIVWRRFRTSYMNFLKAPSTTTPSTPKFTHS